MTPDELREEHHTHTEPVANCPACLERILEELEQKEPDMVIKLEIDCGECMGIGRHQDGDEAEMCLACEGKGKVPLYDPRDKCESCGELSDDLEVVEDRDDEVGFYETRAVCGECRREVKRQEAEFYGGGLRAGALEMLGVDEAWMYEGSTAPEKPMGRAPVVSAGNFAEERWLGGGLA
jgi:RecJ-like exonuclease